MASILFENLQILLLTQFSKAEWPKQEGPRNQNILYVKNLSLFGNKDGTNQFLPKQLSVSV